MEKSAIKEEWLTTLRPGSFSTLFEFLPETFFFAKDRKLRLMGGNRLFVERCGFASEAEMVGHSDYDIFPVGLAETFRADDELVITSGEPRIGLIELFPNRLGTPAWFVTDKIPIFSTDGECAGLCGVVRNFEWATVSRQPHLDLRPAIKYLNANLEKRVSIPELAQHAGMSVRKLQRSFNETFKVTPQRYLANLRVLKGCELLVSSSLSMTDIALEIGFFDHSAFSKRFAEIVGVSPSAYRNRYRSTDSR